MKPNVLLVAHDAGGAEILSAWFRKMRTDYHVSVAAEGPALRIFNRDHQGVPFVPLSFMDGLRRPDFVLTGTSLEADLERNAIKLAKKNDILCISFIDHWDLYRERFGNESHWFAGLPDEVWLGDHYAYQYAMQQGFPSGKLRLVANPYMEGICEEGKGAADRKKAGNEILYIGEPISRKLAVTFGDRVCQYHDEMVLMRAFLEALLAHRGEFDRVTIRLHPSEKKSKYENLLSGYQEKLPVFFSSQERLIDDLLSHAVIVGIESNALVAAIHLGKPVFSCITGKQWAISLPHQEIRRINNFHQIFQPDRESA